MIDQKDKLRMASGRLEGLGDGIFAVAMTILIIEVAVPVVKGNSFSDFWTALQQSGHSLLCYAISFVVLGIMWFGHRMVFEYIAKTNRYFIFLGVLFYMIVCLVPFSTRFLSANLFQWYAIMVYGLNLSLCNLTLFAQWSYGIRNNKLLERDLPHEVKMEAKRLFLLSPVVYTIAIAISFFTPLASILIYIVTPIVYLLPNKLDKYLP